MLAGLSEFGGNLFESFSGGGFLEAEKWNPFHKLRALSETNKSGVDVGISFFRRQTFGQRLSTLFFTLAGEPNQAGVLDYLLFAPAALRFLCAAASKVDTTHVFSAAVAGLLVTPRLALYALVNLVAALMVVALFVPMLFLHAGVSLYNLHAESKLNYGTPYGGVSPNSPGAIRARAVACAAVAAAQAYEQRLVAGGYSVSVAGQTVRGHGASSGDTLRPSYGGGRQ